VLQASNWLQVEKTHVVMLLFGQPIMRKTLVRAPAASAAVAMRIGTLRTATATTIATRSASTSTTTLAAAAGTTSGRGIAAATAKSNQKYLPVQTGSLLVTERERPVAPPRFFSSSTNESTDLSSLYRIEVSNASKSHPDTTKLTVRGPDVDGIMASMTVALATRGCSLLELHAAKATGFIDAASHVHRQSSDDEDCIEDVFYVVNRSTGKPFEDDELEDLGRSLLKALKTPLNVLNSAGGIGIDRQRPKPAVAAAADAAGNDGTGGGGSIESQITVVKKSAGS